jgi:PadR family transcriptional regulator, regulatory protein PadR
VLESTRLEVRWHDTLCRPLYLTTEYKTIPRSIRMSNKRDARVDLFRGTLDVMILQTLETLGPLHGYAISARLEQVSGGGLQLNMGTLYPGLMRLEQRGFIRGRWGMTDSSRRARFYELTARGRRQLASEREEWDRMAAIMRELFRSEA